MLEEKYKPIHSRKIKCLIANDESFQLKFQALILKNLNFKVHVAENGQVAFNKVRNFIENYNKVRQRLQLPGANCQNLNSSQQKLIQTTLKNYDLIILDLNMPILNGYQACQRICDVYQSFNSLPDYDDIISNRSKEQNHLKAIQRIFQENNIPFQEDSDKISSSQIDNKHFESQFDQNSQFKSINNMIKNVKEFYEFKSLFNGMIHVRPLMVACSADISLQVQQQAKSSGFDIVLQAPLTESQVKNIIMVELEKKYQIQARINDKNLDFERIKSVQIESRNFLSKKKPTEFQKSAAIKDEKKIIENISS